MRNYDDSLPTRASMRAGLKVRKMRTVERRHVRTVRTQAPKVESLRLIAARVAA
jgi:hypothetical protein